MRIATVNINDIRVAAHEDIGEWLVVFAPDILLLQEVRIDGRIAVDPLPGYEAVIWPCRIKGCVGVGITVREGGLATSGGLRYSVTASGAEEPDVDSGRWLEADLDLAGSDSIERLTVIPAYLHSGRLGTEKTDQKYAHLKLVDARMTKLLATARDGGPQIVVAGDLNIMRSKHDIRNWKPSRNEIAGIMDEEIAYLEGRFASGWVDASRHLVGDEGQGPYTWWSQRGKTFNNNVDQRIDYQVLTPALAGRAHSVTVDWAPGYTSRRSDHAPFVVEYR